MSIPTVYIKGTKKAANERLVKGFSVAGTEYTPYDSHPRNITEMPDGTVIKFWEKTDHCGTPIAKSYGNWKPSKNKIV